MYKNIEILNKEKFKNLKFDDVDAKEVGKNIGLIPLGFTEIWSASFNSAIIISAGDNAEFIAFCGINLDITIFNKEDELILQTPLSKLKKNNIFSIPLSYFVDSAKSNKPINVTAQTKSHETRYRNLGYFNYIGWYAKIEEY